MNYVQYGAGLDCPEGWINFDASPTARFEKIPVIGRIYTKNQERFPENVIFGDVTRGLPIKDEDCEGVYCSHVLEHLSYVDFHKAINETYRILKPGGIFRLVVPDLEVLAENYLTRTKQGDPRAAYDFMKNSYLGTVSRPRSLSAFFSNWIGNSKHLWMWDYFSLREELEKAGFEDIRRAQFNDSSDVMFMKVENMARFKDACAIEAIRSTKVIKNIHKNRQ